MPTHVLPAVPALATTTNFALISILARYRGDTLRAYQQDLKAYVRWCAERQLQPLQVKRPHLELYVRWLEDRGYAPATIGRRFNTVAGFYRYAVLDGHLHVDPSVAVTRPKVPWEAQRRTVLHPLEFAALLTAARDHSPGSHALVALLGMIGLRVGETCRINVNDLHAQAGYELLTVLGKGSKPALIPLPVPVLRAVREAIDDRQAGPLLLKTRGGRLRPSRASTRLRTLARRAGLSRSSVRTACDGPSAPPAYSSTSRCATCSSPCATPTAAPPCATTWPAPTSTGTPPTPSPPTSQA